MCPPSCRPVGGQGVVSIQIEAVGHAVGAFDFERCSLLHRVEGGVESGPVLIRRAAVDIDAGCGTRCRGWCWRGSGSDLR